MLDIYRLQIRDDFGSDRFVGQLLVNHCCNVLWNTTKVDDEKSTLAKRRNKRNSLYFQTFARFFSSFLFGECLSFESTQHSNRNAPNYFYNKIYFDKFDIQIPANLRSRNDSSFSLWYAKFGMLKIVALVRFNRCFRPFQCPMFLNASYRPLPAEFRQRSCQPAVPSSARDQPP